MAKASLTTAARATEPSEVDYAGLSEITGFVVRLANLLLFRDFYEHFAGNSSGLTLGAISVMAVIDANPGIRQGAAAEALLIKRSNMTKLVNRLERTGLVRRRASGRDRRAVGLHLTPVGRRRLGVLLPAVAAHDAEFDPAADAPGAPSSGFSARQASRRQARRRLNSRPYPRSTLPQLEATTRRDDAPRPSAIFPP